LIAFPHLRSFERFERLGRARKILRLSRPLEHCEIWHSLRAFARF
jgi:hypothetical protein